MIIFIPSLNVILLELLVHLFFSSFFIKILIDKLYINFKIFNNYLNDLPTSNIKIPKNNHFVPSFLL